MKTLTIAEFESLVARNDWQRSQEIEWIDTISRPKMEHSEDLDDVVETEVPHSFGQGRVISELGDIRITYTESYNYDDHQPETFVTGTEGQDEIWLLEGAVVVDEDGDKLDQGDLHDYLPDDFSNVDYTDLKASIDEVIDIDVDEESAMETYTLEIDNEPNLRFTGERIAYTSSSPNEAMGGSYSGKAGRWTVLTLYKTKGGKYICHQEGHTQWVGERTRYSGKVCETLDQVKDFFGHRWLAKELYDLAGIENVREVE